MKHTHKKKSKFFTFIFSCVPGAAEMYMGFMNNGLSLLIIFMLACLMCWAWSDIFFLVLPIIWIYGFFHAWNVAGLDDEKFAEAEDVYIWEEFTEGRSISIPEEKVKKILPFALIFIGAGVLWNYLTRIILSMVPGEQWHFVYVLIDRIPGNVIAVICIVLGIRLIKGKKKQIDMESEEKMDGYDNESA